MKRGRKPKCPYCGSKESINKGVRETKTMGKRPLRICSKCRRKFTVGRKAVGSRKASGKPESSAAKASEDRPAESKAAGA